MGLKALARKVLDKNRSLNMALNSDRNLVQSGGVQIEQATPQDWRQFFEERAAILKYDHELPKPDAEARAWEWCIVEWLNQNPSPSEQDRCAWCGKPEDVGTIVPFGESKLPGSITPAGSPGTRRDAKKRLRQWPKWASVENPVKN